MAVLSQSPSSPTAHADGRSRGGGVLADLDDATADGAGAGEVLEQRLAVIAADRAGELERSSLKVPSISSTASCWPGRRRATWWDRRRRCG